MNKNSYLLIFCFICFSISTEARQVEIDSFTSESRPQSQKGHAQVSFESDGIYQIGGNLFEIQLICNDCQSLNDIRLEDVYFETATDDYELAIEFESLVPLPNSEEKIYVLRVSFSDLTSKDLSYEFLTSGEFVVVVRDRINLVESIFRFAVSCGTIIGSPIECQTDSNETQPQELQSTPITPNFTAAAGSTCSMSSQNAKNLLVLWTFLILILFIRFSLNKVYSRK